MTPYQIKEVPAKTFGNRKVFSDVEPKYLDFVVGTKILHASYPSETFYLKKRHEAGEQYYPDGGVSCVDASGAQRSFYMDEVIVHPSVFDVKKPKTETVKKSPVKRGRKKKEA